MDTSKEVRLRLRFYKDLDENIQTISRKFETYSEKKCVLKLKGNHIWMNVTADKKAYWSPHLHIELEKTTENTTHIRGLFGPDPTLWTFFMFLHFMIAGVFLIFSMIAYSDFTLKNSTQTDLLIMMVMVFLWFLLYVIAKNIREKGADQMDELEQQFLKIIE